jgi:RNA polymerase sigma-70 factor (ECF subfamily)
MSFDPPTESELLARAKAGDPDAFGALVEPHLALFYNSILRILGEPADAQDALQEALIGMHRDLSRFEGRSKFTSWAYPVCVHAALMLRRSRVRRREDAMEDLLSHKGDEGRLMDPEATLDWSVAADALVQVEQKEMREFMLKALDEVPDTQRLVFILKDLEDWETEDIARHLEITTTLVRQRLHRTRMFLQERLRSYVTGERPCR